MIICINLRDNPESVAESYWYAKLLNGIGQPAAGSNTIYDMGKTVGSWVVSRVPSPGFPWFAVGMLNHHLAEAAAELMNGRLYSPQDMETWELSLAFTTLGEMAQVGPTHNTIGHVRGNSAIGAFTFDPVGDSEPTYPAMWAAVSENQKSVLTRPTHEGQPVEGRAPLQRQMLTRRSDFFISRTLRLTSQSLAMARTATPAMGGRAWTALESADEGVKAALSLWGNSTLGLLIRTCYAQTTQAGRATMQINALAGFPVPNFAADTPAGQQARQLAPQRYGELATLPLEPISYAFRDANRHKIDAAALELVGLGGNATAARALSHLRSLWCREPAVHGGNESIMKALGLRG